MSEVYIAEEAFDAESDIELSLTPGDKITVTSHDEAGIWSYGSIGSRMGWFPADHARPEGSRPSPPVPTKPSGPSVPRNNSRIQERASMLQGLFGQPAATSNSRDSYPPSQNTYQQQQNVSNYPDETPRSPRSPNGFQSSSNNFVHTLSNPHHPSNNHVRHSAEEGQLRQNQYQRKTSTSSMSDFNPTNTTQRSAPPALPHSKSLPSPPGPRPPVPYTFQFVVETLHPYTKQNNEELSFSPREKLDIIEKPSPSDEWWRARNKSGEMGLVPKTYVKEKQQPFPVLAERLWYKYKIKREDTEDQMRNKSIECYVIRDSEAFPGCFTLSVKGPDKIRHIKITTTSSGYEVGDKKFPSLDAVVDFYRNSPIFIATNGAYQLFLSRPLT